MIGSLAIRESHAALLAAVEQFCAKYPQYKRLVAAAEPGVMTRFWRKNGHTYLKPGDSVLFVKYAESCTIFGLERPYEGTGPLSDSLRASQERQFHVGCFSVRPYWVEPVG